MPDITIHQSKYGDDPCNFHIAKVGDELQVELIYPPHTSRKDDSGKCKYVCVNQESARATDGVRLWYDYNRDGWVIEQASTFQWADDDKVLDHDWREVAFVKSWAREFPPSDHSF